jgi:4-hydroxybenzoyl-CoA thioesterase
LAVFTYPQKVLFQHCDPAGIVFYPRYYEMLNACVEAWCGERLDYDFAQMHGADGMGLPSVRQTAEFQIPSRHGDDLLLTLVPTRLGNSSVDINVSVTCRKELRVTFTNRLVFFSKYTGKSECWPKEIRTKIQIDLEREYDA